MPPLVYTYCPEVSRWFCYGGGVVGVGPTREIAAANWLADYGRVQAQR
jgi:hypothetical protein